MFKHAADGPAAETMPLRQFANPNRGKLQSAGRRTYGMVIIALRSLTEPLSSDDVFFFFCTNAVILLCTFFPPAPTLLHMQVAPDRVEGGRVVGGTEKKRNNVTLGRSENKTIINKRGL